MISRPALAVLLLFSSFAIAADKESELKIGDKVPAFSAKDDTGKEWKSADHIGKDGKIVVVYFYPADLTGGCTKQACGFRDQMKKLQEQGVEVVGVSGDSVENHQLFKKAHELNFTLLSDYDGKIAQLFGVPTKKGARPSKRSTAKCTRSPAA